MTGEPIPDPGPRDWRDQEVWTVVYGFWRQCGARAETATFWADLALEDDRMGVTRADH